MKRWSRIKFFRIGNRANNAIDIAWLRGDKEADMVYWVRRKSLDRG